MMVSEADRIKAIERVRRSMALSSGGSPSFKRKRAVYRALKRNDLEVMSNFQYELALMKLTGDLVRDLYGGSNV
jgi:hypothetical protein